MVRALSLARTVLVTVTDRVVASIRLEHALARAA